MGFCIGFGEFNKKYLYILIAIFFKLISQLTLGLQYSILEPIEAFSKNLSMNPITYFTSYFICSLIIGIICLIINKMLVNNEEFIETLTLNKSFTSIDLLYKEDKKKKIKLTLIFIGLIFVFCEIHDQLFYSNGLVGLDYWMFEIAILSIFMNKYLKYRNKIHQRLSLYICVISSCIIKLISNNLKSRTVNEEDINIYQFIINKFSSWVYIPLFIISFLITITLRSFGNTNIKYLMDIEYIPPASILIVYGLFGFFFCLLYIFFHLLFNIDFFGKINIFEEKIGVTILCTLLYGITNSLKLFFDILIIKDLSPFHMFAKYKIYYLLIQIILLCHKSIDKFKVFYFVEISSDIICFFGFLIYLELIELRCKGLNYNLKKNIIERSKIESNIEEYYGKNEDFKIINDSGSLEIIELPYQEEKEDE